MSKIFDLEEARLEKNIFFKHILYEMLYKKYPDDNIIKFEYAKVCKKININSAKQLLSELLNTSNRTYAMLELAKIEKEQENYQKAREYFEELIGGKNDEYALLELGKLEKKQGNIEKAREYFKKLAKEKNRTYAMLELGKIENEQGNIEEAYKYFELLLETPNKTYATLELGKLEKKQGNIEKSCEYFESLLDEQNKMYALLELVMIYLKIENIEMAYSYFCMLMFELKNEIQKNELLKTLKRINSYFNYKFGKLNINDIESYFDRQLCNYDYDLAIKHCGKHFETDNQLKFFDTIDKVELMNLLNKNLQSQFLYNSTITDFYRFILPYDIANINGINTNTSSYSFKHR